MSLNSAHEGYEYQDLLSAYFILEWALEDVVCTFKIDKKDYSLDRFDEKPLEIKEVLKLPDFTIENDDTGNIFYWEHCGLLHDPDYKARWEEKLKWYKANEIIPLEEGGGKKGTLIISQDRVHYIDGETKGAISYKEIDSLILQAFGK
jgi:hypothetical protein